VRLDNADERARALLETGRCWLLLEVRCSLPDRVGMPCRRGIAEIYDTPGGLVVVFGPPDRARPPTRPLDARNLRRAFVLDPGTIEESFGFLACRRHSYLRVTRRGAVEVARATRAARQERRKVVVLPELESFNRIDAIKQFGASER
jgi:hypothetical protein